MKIVLRLVVCCLVLGALAMGPANGAPEGVRPPRVGVAPGEGASPPRRVGDSENTTLPNLSPLPPYDVYVGPAEHPEGPIWSNARTLGYGTPRAKYALRFTTTILNRGRYSFELVGAPWLPDAGQQDLTTTHAYQCVRFTGELLLGAQRQCVRYDSVGTLTWHAQHQHFHIDGFGRYELRRELAGRADMSAAGLVGRSQKVGWCTSDMWNWREDPSGGRTGEHADEFMFAEERYWYQECTSPVLHAGASWRQGVSPGWADTYPAGYTGQEIPLVGVADGVYWIVTTINPKDNEFGLTIRETNWADNTSAARVRVYAGGTKAQLLGPLPAEPYRDWFDNPREQPGD